MSYDEGESVNLHVIRKGDEIVLSSQIPGDDHAALPSKIGLGSRRSAI